MVAISERFRPHYFTSKPIESELPLPAKKELRRRPRSPVSAWRSDIICQRVAEDGLESLFTPADSANPYSTALWQDAEHFARETLLVEIDTELPTWNISPESIVSGGYQQDLLFMASNFIDLLSKEKRQLSRAELEQQIMTYVKNWAVAHAGTDQVLIWTSYPGLKKDGYHGSTCLKNGRLSRQRLNAKEKHHSFFYVMWAEKDPQSTIIKLHTRQLRAWPNVSQARQLQQELATALEIDQPLTFDDHQPDHNLMENLLTSQLRLPISSQINLIKKVLYQDTHKWHARPEQLPVFDEPAFWAVQRQLFQQFYLEQVARPLLAQIPFLGPDTREHPYWYSQDYQKILRQLDAALPFYQAALLQWISHHNQNPQYLPFGNRRQRLSRQARHPLTTLAKLRHRDQQRQIQLVTQPEQLVQSTARAYHLTVDQSIKHQKISREDRAWLVSNVGFFSAVGNHAFSLALCGGLSPITMPMSLMKEALNFKSLGNFEMRVGALSLPDKKELLTKLDSFVEYAFPDGDIWMLDPEMLVGEGVYMDPETGIKYGPCRDETGQRIPLTVSEGTLAFHKNQAEFDRYREVINQQITDDEAQQLEKSIEKHQAFSPSQKAESEQLIAQLMQLLFRRHLNLDQLINNDLVDDSQLVRSRIFENVTKLLIHSAVNPVVTMRQLVIQLSENPNMLHRLQEYGFSLPTLQAVAV